MTAADKEQTLALAAACQAVSSVIDVARHGRSDAALVNSCLQGLVQPYRPDVAALYGGMEQLRPGLIALQAQLTRPQDVEFTRYCILLLHLERRLRRQPARLQGIATGLERARRQAQYFDGPSSGPVVAALAHLYSEHISTLRPRILITGERAYLEQAQNADLIRALLLAAIRALSFWRQHGGSRIGLFFGRGRILRAVEALLVAA